MIDIKLDDTGDIDLTNGEMTLVEGEEAIEQSCRNRLLFFLGEWFLDTRLGVDWFGTVLVKNPNRPAVQSLLRSVVLSTPGVKSITSFSMELDPALRLLTVDVTGKLEDLSTYVWDIKELLLPEHQEAA